MSNPHDHTYRASNAKWGYAAILKVLNHRCVEMAYNLNGHTNRIENEAIDKAKAIKEGRTHYDRPQTAGDIEQTLAWLLVAVEQAQVLLQDTYPDQAKRNADFVKHARYITEINAEDKD
jgi:hypothetical protein